VPAEAWSIRMEGYGGSAQPSPTIAQCLRGGLNWLEVECNRCKTKGSLAQVPVLPEGSLRAAGAHDQIERGARDHALKVGAS
jgi:hypothetical protein